MGRMTPGVYICEVASSARVWGSSKSKGVEVVPPRGCGTGDISLLDGSFMP